jgi:hypothetical protein
MSEPDKFEDKLKKEVLRHGFPLEIEIQSILEDKDWAVFPTNFYIDPQTGKQRELTYYQFIHKLGILRRLTQ